MVKYFLSILFVMLLFNSNAWSAVTFELDNSEYLSQNDGLSTDINGVNQTITFCAWFRLNSLINGADYILSKYDIDAAQKQYAIFHTSSDILNFAISADGSTTIGETLGVSSVDTWYHVCGVYDDIDLKGYRDGVVGGSPTAHTGGLDNGTAKFAIGGRFNSGAASNFTDADIDEVYVWDTDLTAAEVARLFNSKVRGSGRQIQASNLQLYCALDQCPIGTDNCSTDFVCTPGSVMVPTNTPSGLPGERLTY